MVNAGKRHVKVLPDGWTVVTKDRSLSAQWEHTILVTETGHEILTLREEERAELADADAGAGDDVEEPFRARGAGAA
jgi:methionyl aminopeptidase